jgi:hypothetical protein
MTTITIAKNIVHAPKLNLFKTIIDRYPGTKAREV